MQAMQLHSEECVNAAVEIAYEITLGMNWMYSLRHLEYTQTADSLLDARAALVVCMIQIAGEGYETEISRKSILTSRPFDEAQETVIGYFKDVLDGMDELDIGDEYTGILADAIEWLEGQRRPAKYVPEDQFTVLRGGMTALEA